MTVEVFFQVTDTLALMAWIGLVLLPGKKVVSGVAHAISPDAPWSRRLGAARARRPDARG